MNQYEFPGLDTATPPARFYFWTRAAAVALLLTLTLFTCDQLRTHSPDVTPTNPPPNSSPESTNRHRNQLPPT